MFVRAFKPIDHNSGAKSPNRTNHAMALACWQIKLIVLQIKMLSHAWDFFSQLDGRPQVVPLLSKILKYSTLII